MASVALTQQTRMGKFCSNVNRNLKWAFVETGNLIVINQRRLAGTHVVRLDVLQP